MDTASVSLFFAVLSLACWAATSAIVVMVVVRRFRPSSAAADGLDAIASSGLWLGWLVAAVATAGSLYYSQVAHYQPCDLCWYQRICMYPLTAVLFVAAVRRDRAIWRYVLPQACVGAVIAAYHTQLQAFPAQSTFCSALDPCTSRYVWEFGFVSLPFMALAAFCFVIAVLAVAAHEPAAVVPYASPIPAPTPIGVS
jgi:disulfide bond formation protein DsbB